MADPSELHNQIAAALTGVVKQIKAIRYYPPRHPALQSAAEECLRGFQPVLGEDNHLQLAIRKEGFLFDDEVVAKGNQVLGQLAMFCFARRIQYLTILSDLSAKDLNHFVHYLNLDYQKIQGLGGVQALLEKAQVTTIWTNLQDLDDIFERREEIERQPPQPDIDPAAVIAEEDVTTREKAQTEAIELSKLLKKLEQEKDDARFRHGLQQLIPLLRQHMTDESRQLVLRAFLLLCRTATSAKLSEERREFSSHALRQLASPEMNNYLLDYLLDDETDEKTRDILFKILAFLRDRVVGLAMERLAEEPVAGRRKLLADALIKCGQAAVPVLQEHLFDERWYVVRNAVAILGEIRSQESLVHLTPLLEHKDIRVRRETIRALTKIGGPKATDILLQAAETGDQELRRQALLSLGAIRAATAVPTLLKVLRQSGWSQKVMDLKKDALKALGEIRSPEATPDLLKIARKRRIVKRNLNDELRVAAISALGETGDESVRDVLEKLTDDKSPAVARAAAQGLKQLDKAGAGL